VYLSRKAAYWRRVLDAADYRPAPGARVLDAGCGPAGVFMVLKEQRVDACDPLLPRYETSIPHFRKEDYPWVRFLEAPLEYLAPETPYESLFCLNAINHVADLTVALDRLVAALAPGGKLLLSVDAHRHDLLKRIFRILPGDILHPHQHDLAEYESMLKRRGLKVERRVLLKPGRIFDYWLLVVSAKH